jgi:hypothetical protein
VLVRAELRGIVLGEQSEDRELLEHIKSCTDEACLYRRCHDAKNAYKHYQECTKDTCNTCANSRLYTCRMAKMISPEAETECRDLRVQVLKCIENFKKATGILDAARKNGATPGELAVAESSSKIMGARYSEAKHKLDSAFRKIYAVFLEARKKLVSAQEGSSYNWQQASTMLIPAGAAGGAPVNTGKPVLPAAGTTSLVPAPSKRGEEILNGHTMEFVLGDTSGSIVEELELVLEALTTTTGRTTAGNQWHVPSDFTEPDWSENNVLTKSDIEAEQSRLLPTSKRLFSHREMEYLSRAAQDLLVDIVAESIQRAKHVRRVVGENAAAPIALTSADLEASLAKRPALRLLEQ